MRSSSSCGSSGGPEAEPKDMTERMANFFASMATFVLESRVCP